MNPEPLELEGLTSEEIWDVHRASGRDVPLREFIDDALAVYIRPHAFSHRELILAVAQQTGSAREDETVEVALVQLEQFLIGGFSGYAGPMSGAAEHALRAGGSYDTPLNITHTSPHTLGLNRNRVIVAHRSRHPFRSTTGVLGRSCAHNTGFVQRSPHPPTARHRITIRRYPLTSAR